MTVRVYRSTDASAPTLTNAAGSLITLLDACLVNGFGAKTAAGWTKAFTGTNRASYRQGTGSNAFYLDVNDTTTISSIVRAYETMTAVNTGTNPFPTAAQVTNYYWLKSSTAAAAGWILIATEKIFYLWVNPLPASFYTSSNSQIYCFGDFVSRKAGDIYSTILIGNSGNNQTLNEINFLHTSLPSSSSTYMTRSYTGTGGSVRAVVTGHIAKQLSNSAWDGTGFDPITKNYNLSPMWVFETSGSNVDRGVLPGIYKFMITYGPNMITAGQGVQLQGTGSLTGKTFEILNAYRSTNTMYYMALEISDTW